MPRALCCVPDGNGSNLDIDVIKTAMMQVLQQYRKEQKQQRQEALQQQLPQEQKFQLVLEQTRKQKGG